MADSWKLKIENKFVPGDKVQVIGFPYLGIGKIIEIRLRLFEPNECLVDFALSGLRTISESKLEAAE